MTTAGHHRYLPASLAVLAVVPAIGPLVLASAAAWVASDANPANVLATERWLEITLSPTSGKKGSTIAVAGRGFAPGSSLSATFAGSAAPWTSNGGREVATPTGTIPSGATIAAKATVPGQYQVTVSDTAGNSASASFRVTN